MALCVDGCMVASGLLVYAVTHAEKGGRRMGVGDIDKSAAFSLCKITLEFLNLCIDIDKDIRHLIFHNTQTYGLKFNT